MNTIDPQNVTLEAVASVINDKARLLRREHVRKEFDRWWLSVGVRCQTARLVSVGSVDSLAALYNLTLEAWLSGAISALQTDL